MKTNLERIPPAAGRAGFAPVSTARCVSEVALTKSAPRPALKRILVPIDFSAESKKALHYAAQFARQFGATISLLHVVEPITFPADYGYGQVIRQIPNKEGIKRAKTRLDRLGQKEIGARCLADPIIRSGTACFEITEVARIMEADLIIIATHACTGASRPAIGSLHDSRIPQRDHEPTPDFSSQGTCYRASAFLLPSSDGLEAGRLTGSTTEKVIRHAPCPVLVVRRKEHEFVL